MSYTSTWDTPTTAPRIRRPTPGMYDTDTSGTEDRTPGAGMYSQAQATDFQNMAPLDFRGLSSGGQNTVASGDTSIATVDPNQTGMYQAYTDLLGTGLQTEAQRDVANTNIVPAMAKLDFTKSTVFPYIQQFLQHNGTVSPGGSSSLNSQFTNSVLRASSPEREQAALNAADADATRAAATTRLLGLNQVAGSGWSPASPVGAALTGAAEAARVAAAEEAKRKIRDDYGQQRVTNLASALNANSQQINPIYSLLSSLMN